MAYSDKAAELRRCKAHRQDGQECAAWAMWDDPDGYCVAHARGRKRGTNWTDWERRELMAAGVYYRRAKYKPCNCVAYAWPHRPGGGLCNWPDPPDMMRTTPAGTHSLRWERAPSGPFAGYVEIFERQIRLILGEARRAKRNAYQRRQQRYFYAFRKKHGTGPAPW